MRIRELSYFVFHDSNTYRRTSAYLSYLFDHAWNRVREYGGAPAGGMGVGLHEARHWHRRAYGAVSAVLELSRPI